jgi:hypothetical protein
MNEAVDVSTYHRRRFSAARIVAAVVAALCALAAAAFFYAPTYVRHTIEKRAPYVTIHGPVDVHWSRVVLHDVEVEKPNLHAQLPLVTVFREDESVLIEGGQVDYVLAHREGHATETSDGHRIDAHRLSVTVHQPKEYSDTFDTVDLIDVDVDDRQVCFNQFGIRRGQELLADGEGGCVARDRSSGHIDKVTIYAMHEAGSYLALFESTLLGRGTPFAENDDYLVLLDLHFEEKGAARRLTAGEGRLGSIEAHGVSVEYASEPAHVDVAADAVTMNVPRVFGTPFTVSHLSTSFDPGHVKEHPIEASVNGVTVHVDPNTYGVSGEEDCQSWLLALPAEMRVGAFDGLRFTGRLGFDVQTKPDVKVALRNSCKAVCPVPAIEALRQPFERTIYVSPGDEEVTAIAGPGTPTWTPLAEIGPVMPMAVINMEDKGFPTHHGIIPAAIENSLREDVQKGRFVRGGSTITMQLAKNVFLRRSKTIGRKLQEVFLTMALESCLSKDQIMELYLNVVQFGRNLYGIGAAARTYFHKKPDELTPQEAFYLASILPRPAHAPSPNDATMKRVASLMRTLASRGSIDPDIVPDTTDEP